MSPPTYFVRVASAAIFAMLPVSCSATLASAHSALAHASPAAGSTVHKSPIQVKLWFTEEIEVAVSSITVFDASGHEVDKKDLATSPDDKKILLVSISALLPGKYTVRWRVVSVDTHKTQGSFPFVVAP